MGRLKLRDPNSDVVEIVRCGTGGLKKTVSKPGVPTISSAEARGTKAQGHRPRHRGAAPDPALRVSVLSVEHPDIRDFADTHRLIDRLDLVVAFGSSAA